MDSPRARPPNGVRHAAVDAVLAELVTGAQGVLGTRLVGAYLLGSFSTGHSDRHSDVDFLIAVADDIPLHELAELQRLHGRIYDRDFSWAKRLDGSYVPARILRRQDEARTVLPYLDNGRRTLAASEPCNRLVIRQLLRESGVALVGPEPNTLIDPISLVALRDEVVRDMREWADEIRDAPEAMNNRWYQPYVVLSYCRMLYTLRTGGIASKRDAARWARETLESEWSELIRRAVGERGDPFRKIRQAADPSDVELTRAFVARALERV